MPGHPHALYSSEEGIRSFGTGVMNGCEAPCGYTETMIRSSENTTRLLSHETISPAPKRDSFLSPSVGIDNVNPLGSSGLRPSWTSSPMHHEHPDTPLWPWPAQSQRYLPLTLPTWYFSETGKCHCVSFPRFTFCSVQPYCWQQSSCNSLSGLKCQLHHALMVQPWCIGCFSIAVTTRSDQGDL